MPVVQLVTAFISSIAWPIVGLAALLIFKGPIERAVSGTSGGRPLRRVKAGSFEVEWEQLDKTEQEIFDAPSSREAGESQGKGDDSSEESASKSFNEEDDQQASKGELVDLYSLAHSFPAAAILLAFKRVERRTLEVAKELNVIQEESSKSRDRSWRDSMQSLLRNEVVDSRTAKGFHSLRVIRNQVTHAQNEEEVTSARAVQYLMVASDVMAALSAAEHP